MASLAQSLANLGSGHACMQSPLFAKEQSQAVKGLANRKGGWLGPWGERKASEGVYKVVPRNTYTAVHIHVLHHPSAWRAHLHARPCATSATPAATQECCPPKGHNRTFLYPAATACYQAKVHSTVAHTEVARSRPTHTLRTLKEIPVWHRCWRALHPLNWPWACAAAAAACPDQCLKQGARPAPSPEGIAGSRGSRECR